MSYAFNNTVSFRGTPQVDAFSRFRTSELQSVLEVKHVFDKQPLLIDELTEGTGEATFTPTNSDIEMTTTSNGSFVIRSTKGRGVYAPGKGGLFEATFMNFQIQSNITKRVGYYSTSSTFPYDGTPDGFFLESNGTTGIISFQVWRSGTKVFDMPLSQWDSSIFDPATIDWTKDQFLWVDFAWLGAGEIRFGLVLPGVGFVTFGSLTAANTIIDPYMTNPNQPIRYEIRQTGTGSGVFHQLCAQYGIEGAQNALSKSVSIANNTERSLAVPGVKYPLLGFRCSNSYKGSNITLESIFALNQFSGTDYLITVEMNPGIAGGVPSWSNVTNTPVQFSQGNGLITATTNPNMPSLTIKSYLGKGNAATTDNYTLTDNLIKPGVCINGVQDEIWICVTPLITTGVTKIRSIVANLVYFD